MGQVNVTVGGRSYALNCRDGEEKRLQLLADIVDRKAQDLHGALGQVSEVRLLLMSALLLADNLIETKDKPPAEGPAEAEAALRKATQWIDALTDTLEMKPRAS